MPSLERPDLLARPVLRSLRDAPYAGKVGVVEIPPEFSDTAAMMAEYHLPFTVAVNCVLIAGKRAGTERIAACLVRADTRADVNGAARRALDVRGPSFMPQERATCESEMEFGGITPFGLPQNWRIFVDPRVFDIDVAVLGSGLRRSKLLVAGSVLRQLPTAEALEGLGN
ncbi:hypothetical protein MTX37_29055 [Rhodococcus sp. ARC_M8]|uniref:YbaK/EbsC family protein n=1 Tax=Rhodococcus sp. ARC_M8 TaxID=2928853 RepID=UPI001FB43A00|nr:YbaK/EbsC family protein [Rhodococcus sp. ARC_M8]MCJ0949975.1 hypothetical protein [Rhodococcus sp. ARC_M8]